jgi:hypothetical protein
MKIGNNEIGSTISARRVSAVVSGAKLREILETCKSTSSGRKKPTGEQLAKLKNLIEGVIKPTGNKYYITNKD